MRDRTRNLTLAAMALTLAVSGCSSTGTSSDDDLAFWSMLAFASSSVEVYSSVREMAAGADLVVVGSIGEVTVGREWGDSREPANSVASLLFQVKVTQVVRGEMPEGITDTVTWEHSFPAYGAAQLSGRLTSEGMVDDRTRQVRPYPKGHVLLFLRLRNDMGSELAVMEGAAFAGGVSYRLVTPQGMVAEDGESATSPLAAANLALDESGRPYELDLPEQLLAEEIATHSFEELTKLAQTG